MSVETHILHPLYYDFTYEAAHTTTNSLMAVILWIDILFTGFSQLVRVGPTRSCFDLLASEFNVFLTVEPEPY